MCAGIAGKDKPSTAPVATAQPPPEKLSKVNAGALAAAYETNEVAADQKYKGQRFEVIGTVAKVQKDLIGSPQVLLGGSVVANGLSEASAANLKVGELISVKCSVTGYTLTFVSLDCG
jgi:hypothetical protein